MFGTKTSEQDDKNSCRATASFRRPSSAFGAPVEPPGSRKRGGRSPCYRGTLPVSSISFSLPLLPLLERLSFTLVDFLLALSSLLLPLEIGFSLPLSCIVPSILLIISTIPLAIPIPLRIPAIRD
jgi:hypothetical protein